jgi:hypothetical protein
MILDFEGLLLSAVRRFFIPYGSQPDPFGRRVPSLHGGQTFERTINQRFNGRVFE